MHRRFFPGLLALLAALLLPAASASARVPMPPRVVVDLEGVAIGGYDPVAYFTEGRAVPGVPEHRYRWSNAIWLFASAAARDRFAADPGAYAPAFGGWCAWAMSENRLARGDPRIWNVIGGRLYFNCNPEARRRWMADLSGAIARGEENWARMTAAAGD